MNDNDDIIVALATCGCSNGALEIINRALHIILEISRINFYYF